MVNFLKGYLALHNSKNKCEFHWHTFILVAMESPSVQVAAELLARRNSQVLSSNPVCMPELA